MPIIIECAGCGLQQSGSFLELNGHVGILLFHRSFNVEVLHEEQVHVCGECYETLCDMLHLHGGKRD